MASEPSPVPRSPGGHHLLSTFIVTNTDDSGAGSLRQAILDANATPGADDDRLRHRRRACRRSPGLAPADDHRPGGHRRHHPAGLRRHAADRAGRHELRRRRDGLDDPAGDSTVRGLDINRFAERRHHLRHRATGATIEGNYIGTDPTGTIARGNGGFGVDLQNNFVNKIGGTAAGQGNVISGNALGGINAAGGSSLLMSENNSVVRIDTQTGAVLATYATGVATGSALIEADGSLYVADYYGNKVLHFDAFGNALPSFGVGHLSNPQDMIFGPAGNLYVGSADGSVKKFDPSGTFLGNFVSAGSGGLSNAKGMAFGPDGNFYVASYGNNSILRYDGKTGAFLNVFTSGSGGLLRPRGHRLRPRRQPVREQLRHQAGPPLPRLGRGLPRRVRERGHRPRSGVRPRLRRGREPPGGQRIQRHHQHLQRNVECPPAHPRDRPGGLPII